MCCGHGTRQSDRMGRPGTRLCRVPKCSTRQSDHTSPCAPGAAHGTRRSLELCRVHAVRAHGKAWIFIVCPRRRHMANNRRRRQLAVTASACFFAMCLYIHTVYSFAVCPTIGTQQTRSLPSLLLLSALCRRPPSTKSSPCAYGSSPCASGTRQTRGLR